MAAHAAWIRDDLDEQQPRLELLEEMRQGFQVLGACWARQDQLPVDANAMSLLGKGRPGSARYCMAPDPWFRVTSDVAWLGGAPDTEL